VPTQDRDGRIQVVQRFILATEDCQHVSAPHQDAASEDAARSLHRLIEMSQAASSITCQCHREAKARAYVSLALAEAAGLR
jgi:hypothetical protein